MRGGVKHLIVTTEEALAAAYSHAHGPSAFPFLLKLRAVYLASQDGLAKSSDLVFVLAASNIPWELDMALLRRLEKRVLVPLPDEAAREVLPPSSPPFLHFLTSPPMPWLLSCVQQRCHCSFFVPFCVYPPS